MSLASKEGRRAESPVGTTADRTAVASRKRTISLFLAFFAMSAAWALATPLFSAPDERSHAIKAAGTVRGQLWGEEVSGTSVTVMKVPAWLANAKGDCFRYHPQADILCISASEAETEVVEVPARAGRYPPLYYLLVGAPTFLRDPQRILYAMRILSAFIGAGFLTAAFLLAARSRAAPFLLAGLAVALTPMVFYLLGSVNPNGLEVSSAICLWIAGTVIVRDGLPRPRRASFFLLGCLVLAASVLALTRSASPLFAAVALVVLLLFAGRAQAVRLAKDRRVWIALGLVAGVGLIAALMVLWADPYPGPVETIDPRGFEARLGRSLGRQRDWALQAVGIFGILDTPAPRYVFLVWFPVTLSLVAIAVLQSIRRAAVVVLLVATIVVLSSLVEAMALRTMGPFWQGRYSLPLAAGIPILASAAIAPGSRALRWLQKPMVVVPVLGGLMLAHVASILGTAHRFSVGSDGPWSFVWDGSAWIPPVSFFVSLGAFTISALYLAASFSRAILRTTSEGTEAGVRPSHAASSHLEA